MYNAHTLDTSDVKLTDENVLGFARMVLGIYFIYVACDCFFNIGIFSTSPFHTLKSSYDIYYIAVLFVILLGLYIFLGIFTRPFALLLCILSAGSVYLTKDYYCFFSNMYNAMPAVGALMLVVKGGGNWSVDILLKE
jgi:uncharacterized membrane protein YphA (DoxX/SURF4 family)